MEQSIKVFNKMDRVCSNCGRRFGRHYGTEKTGYFCYCDSYILYDETGERDLSKIFIDSGEKEDSHGKRYSIKDPNILFSLAKKNRM